MKYRKRQYRREINHEKYRTTQWHNEHKAGGFKCSHCKRFVIINDSMGTANRNHCNMCLWSKHVDEHKGDRLAVCQSGMQPIGLTFKHAGYDRIGELMLIHLCAGCQKLSINRIARDDPEHIILEIFVAAQRVDTCTKSTLHDADIYLLSEADKAELERQLFGR